jgi:hypothetical protein
MNWRSTSFCLGDWLGDMVGHHWSDYICGSDLAASFLHRGDCGYWLNAQLVFDVLELRC